MWLGRGVQPYNIVWPSTIPQSWPSGELVVVVRSMMTFADECFSRHSATDTSNVTNAAIDLLGFMFSSLLRDIAVEVIAIQGICVLCAHQWLPRPFYTKFTLFWCHSLSVMILIVEFPYSSFPEVVAQRSPLLFFWFMAEISSVTVQLKISQIFNVKSNLHWHCSFPFALQRKSQACQACTKVAKTLHCFIFSQWSS